MAWADLVESANTAFLATWGIVANGGTVTLCPQDGSGPFPIDGVIKNPGLDEEVMPGTAGGTGVLRLWVDYQHLSPQPVKGDTIVVNGISYTTAQPDVDVEGAAVLRLRKAG